MAERMGRTGGRFFERYGELGTAKEREPREIKIPKKRGKRYRLWGIIPRDHL